MDRYPHETPCRVSIEELAHDRGLQEFSDEDLQEAREEIAEEIMDGPKLWQSLESWLNVGNYEERFAILATHFQSLLQGAVMDRGAFETHEQCRQAGFACARADARTWLEEVVRESIRDEKVEDRAAEIAGARLEDASL